MPTQASPTKARSDIRAGVFTHVDHARVAVNSLRQAGFTSDQISVVCSEETKEQHFEAFEHEEPAGTHAPEKAVVGGATGALVGGLITAGVTTAAGISLVAAGPLLLVGGAVAGGFIGAMQSRGAEKTLANYYDQALTHGDLLVAVEDDKPGNQDRLRIAEELLRDAGARPLPLESQDQAIESMKARAKGKPH